MSVNILHASHSVIPLGDITLINTDGIDPEEVSHRYISSSLEGHVQIESDGKCVVVEAQLVWRRLFSTDVALRFIINTVIECNCFKGANCIRNLVCSCGKVKGPYLGFFKVSEAGTEKTCRRRRSSRIKPRRTGAEARINVTRVAMIPRNVDTLVH